MMRARGGAMKRLQVLCIVVVGFIAGYFSLSYMFSSQEHTVNVQDRGIHFDKSGTKFVIDGKEKLILSGAIHYFRVIPEYWKDRLLRLKAAGLNTVETYVSWNLHEVIPDQFDFTGILDIKAFILMAQHLGLHVIVRPGPYICAEWEMGGLPAWLLHYPDMELRTTHSKFLSAVERYFHHLFDILVPLQSSFGGPIIAIQIENEYSGHLWSMGQMGKDYMFFLFQLLRKVGVVELLFTSDNQKFVDQSLTMRPAEEVLLTLNFMNDHGGLDRLKVIQPDKPRMVMEFWTGWFDHWNDSHLSRDNEPMELATKFATMISDGVSINFYMFHGGTNFGFMNGGSWDRVVHELYKPLVSSYDYGAPVSECGDITEKYLKIREVISRLAPDSMSVSPLPPIPENLPKRAYGETELTQYISILNTLQHTAEPYSASSPVSMEYLPVNKGWGQEHGYILYRTLIPHNAHQVTVHHLRDFGIAMINFIPVKRLLTFQDSSFIISETSHKVKEQREINLDILVENAGRVNTDLRRENRKGINGQVEVDGVEHKGWNMYALEFKSSFLYTIDSGGKWLRTPSPVNPGPTLFKGTFTVRGPPCDTFADMKGWSKGVLFINGMNLGRYWSVGPQRTLYIPGPILREGVNKIMIFELLEPKTPQTVVFRDEPILNDNS